MILLRMVPVVAFASAGLPVSAAATRVRLNAITSQTSQAALAQDVLMACVREAEFFSPACTCSMIACRR